MVKFIVIRFNLGGFVSIHASFPGLEDFGQREVEWQELHLVGKSRWQWCHRVLGGLGERSGNRHVVAG